MERFRCLFRPEAAEGFWKVHGQTGLRTNSNPVLVITKFFVSHCWSLARLLTSATRDLRRLMAFLSRSWNQTFVLIRVPDQWFNAYLP